MLSVKKIHYAYNKWVRRVAIKKCGIHIVGCGHSGTSLLASIIDSHSNIYMVPEETSMAWTDNRKWYNECKASFEKNAIAKNCLRWAEKTPRHVHKIENIFKWNEEIKVVFISRDPRDTCSSLFKRYNDLEQSIERWNIDNIAGIEYLKNDHVYHIKYEDIITSFEETISRLMDFLDEKYESQQAYFHKIEKKWYFNTIKKPNEYNKYTHTQFRNWQINQPLFDGRNRRHELNEKQLDLIMKKTKQVREVLGYQN
tara:strand:- start:8 stop:772 length:765 start_codon:yes stop_codon:yes gene_type:complete